MILKAQQQSRKRLCCLIDFTVLQNEVYNNINASSSDKCNELGFSISYSPFATQKTRLPRTLIFSARFAHTCLQNTR